MKLGVFDSGLGGLIITKAIRDKIPDIDILYFGDTLHVPYGSRSTKAITLYTKRALSYMFDQGCTLIVIACNTASAACLRDIQQNWLPGAYPGRNVIGVVVPMLEEAADRNHENIALIATDYIIKSGVYTEELQKLNPSIKLYQKATPLLVPLIERGGMKWIGEVLEEYLFPIKQKNPDAIILGCTHYPCLKLRISQILGQGCTIISPDDILPVKLADYLNRHAEYNEKISRNSTIEYHLSDLTDHYRDIAKTLINEEILLKQVNIHE